MQMGSWHAAVWHAILHLTTTLNTFCWFFYIIIHVAFVTNINRENTWNIFVVLKSNLTHVGPIKRDGSGCRPWANGAPLSNRKYVTSTQCCQVRGFPSELGYFKISYRGLFFMSTGWSEPNNVIFSPCNVNFTRENLSKNVNFMPPERDFYQGPPWNAIGLSWAFFFFCLVFQRTITYNILSSNNIKKDVTT